MKILAVLANFFLPGLGYLMAVPHKRLQGLAFLIGALGLSYVEQVALGPEHAAFMPMFVAVFIMNTGFAYDAWKEVSELEVQTA
ncbi:MAG: hypothetical protein H6741_27980 [Alphaproteobacteria bacterium]|nr:hypothetical protein [Alphaproteobacteria bacterium]MCB9796555.1 hypothetical protein [Alphaproteobacteria bacterium]